MAGHRCSRKVRAAQSRVPGESQGGRRRPVDSPDWRIGRPVREQQKPTRTRRREPAEKGNPPCSNLQHDRYQVARRGQKSRAAATREGRPVARPREMTIANRTRLTVRPARLSNNLYGAFSSVGRALVCGTRGHGFKPRKAPSVQPVHLRGLLRPCRFPDSLILDPGVRRPWRLTILAAGT